MISQNSLILHHFYYYAIVVKTAGLCARRSLVRTRSNLFGGSKGTIGISKPPGDFRFFTLHQIANTLISAQSARSAVCSKLPLNQI